MQDTRRLYSTDSEEFRMRFLAKGPTSLFPGCRNPSSLTVDLVHATCLSSQAAKVHQLLLIVHFYTDLLLKVIIMV